MGDIIRKFTIPTYSSGTVYSKYDVVKVTSSNKEYYFVSIHEGGNTNNINTGNLLSNSFWKRFDDINVDINDIWTPSYTSSVNAEPRTNTSQLEDGTTLMGNDGINGKIIRFQLNFENIGDKEAFSLLCFADFVGPKRAFNWTAPSPYEKRLKFNLAAIRHTFESKNRNNVSISIEAAFTIFGVGAGQQSFGTFES